MLDQAVIFRPRVEFDTDALGQNFALLAELCAAHGISVSGVTRATGGNPRIARLMLECGIDTLAEARLANIARLRAGGIEAPIMLLRPPAMARSPMRRGWRMFYCFLKSPRPARWPVQKPNWGSGHRSS